MFVDRSRSEREPEADRLSRQRLVARPQPESIDGRGGRQVRVHVADAAAQVIDADGRIDQDHDVAREATRRRRPGSSVGSVPPSFGEESVDNIECRFHMS